MVINTVTHASRSLKSSFATLPLQTYHLYNKDGYLTREGLGRDLANANKPQTAPYYRKINNMSPRDQLVNVSYGNDALDYWNYGPANGQMSEMISSVPGLPEKLAELEYSFDEFGNLDIQTNHLIDVEEQFNYDQLHRLISRNLAQMSATTPIDPYTVSALAPDPQPKPFEFPEGVDYSYDALGNILTKSDYADNYQYQQQTHDICPFGVNPVTPGPHAVTQVTAQVKSQGGTTPQDYRMAYDANGNLICSQDGNLTVQYDAFNLPTHIQRGSITQTFHYGPDLQRYRQVSSGAETLYIDKLYERKGTIERFYVGGYLVIERNSAGQDTQSYTHKDRLGSTVAITDAAGDTKVRQGFGPFGKARTANWDATDFLPGKALDSRGFTDHEHLENTRLIHMNGRAYDFNLGRFLSIDPIIQFPENSQSLNPYSYLMNNPMAGTDPTGYMSCSVDNPSDCVEQISDLGDGESVNVRGTPTTGSRVSRTLGSASNSGGSISFSSVGGGTLTVSNGSVSTSGTTNTGSQPESIGDPGSKTNSENSSSPSSQADGIKLSPSDISPEARGIAREFGGTFESRSRTFGIFAGLLFLNPNAIQSNFFITASIVAGSFIPLDGDLTAFIAASKFTIDTLRGLSKSVFVNAAEIFLRLNSGNELAGARGLRGSALDAAIIDFEQGTVVENFINRRLPRNSLTRMIVNGEINELSDGVGIFGFSLIRDESFREASRRADRRGFNFINKNDRIVFGNDLNNILINR